MIEILGHIPKLTLIGMTLFVISGTGIVYIGYRINGWRSFLPFPPKQKPLKIYWQSIREGTLPAWPLYLWLIGTPIAIIIFFAGIISLRKV